MSAAIQTLVTPKFQNILFMTDFSLCSELASPFARALAQRYGSTIHAVHVVSPRPVVIGGEFGGADIELERESEDTACLRMNEFLQSGAFDGVLYTQTIQTGTVRDVLTELVAGLNIDLIVLGTHGRRGLQHLLIGSVAEQVFRHAPCPVLTVGPKIHENGLLRRHIDTILYATDFSAASLHALDYGVYLARTWNARMVLLHSMEGPSKGIGQVEQRLRALVASTDIAFGVVVGSRPAAEMILSAARDLSADITVMGAHRGPPTWAHAPWAVAHRVVCNAPCPVLTVRS